MTNKKKLPLPLSIYRAQLPLEAGPRLTTDYEHPQSNKKKTYDIVRKTP